MALPLVAPFISGAIAWIFNTIVIKAGVFFTTYTMMALGLGLASAFMVTCCDISFSGLSNIISSIPPNIWWFLDLVNFQSGLKIILSAIVTRWMIGWIPFSPK